MGYSLNNLVAMVTNNIACEQAPSESEKNSASEASETRGSL